MTQNEKYVQPSLFIFSEKNKLKKLWLLYKQKTHKLLYRYLEFWDRESLKGIGPLLFIVVFGVMMSSLEFALVLTISMLLHELAHAFVFEKSGIKWHLVWAFPLGAAILPASRQENKESDLLPYENIGWLAIAGPMVNFLLLLLGAILSFSSLVALSQHLMMINGTLLLSNLIPIGNVDGGVLFAAIFGSLDRKHEHAVFLLMGTLYLILIGSIFFFSPVPLMGAISNISWLLTGFVALIALIVASLKKEVPTKYDQQKMTKLESYTLALLYIAMLIGTLFVWAGPVIL